MPRISLLPAATPANLTGVAIVPTTDKNTLTVGPTYAQLRTVLFAGGTGYATTDPLVIGGTLTFPTTAQIVGGATNGLVVRNSGNTRSNLSISDDGQTFSIADGGRVLSIQAAAASGELPGGYLISPLSGTGNIIRAGLTSGDKMAFGYYNQTTLLSAIEYSSVASGFGVLTLMLSGGSIATGAKITKYNNINTAGWGVPAINGSGRSIAQTAAVASVATYTVGAADGSFKISCNVNVTVSTTHSFTTIVTYTDENNTARTLTIPVCQLTGAVITAITNVTGVGPYEGIAVQIRCKAATVITIATTGTFTTVTYNVEGTIQQVS